MKILVAVKRVIDFSTRIQVKADKSGIEMTNVKMSMNPFDEIAVEEAVRLKEKGIATEVIVVSIGTTQTQETLRHGLAMGADRAILVDTALNMQSLTVAKILQQIIHHENPQLVILGKQAIDDDNNQTGQMLAGLLNWAQGTFASTINIQNEKAEVTREIDGGLETLILKLPAVITTDLRLNQPRYLSLPNIVQAKRKPMTTFSLEQLGITVKQHQKILEVTAPKKERAKIRVATVKELVERLKNEVQVI